jgi:peptide/nickel transport system substrate-binding protein
VDLFAHLSSTQVAQLGDDFNIGEGTMNLVQALYLNNGVAPFDDVRVRQALCYAIDRQQILDLAFDGYGSPIGSSMYPAFGKYFDDSLTDYYTQDIEKAKELLAEAGYPDGFTMTITVPSNYQPHVDTAQVLVEQLKEIGVTAEIQPVEWASWLSDVYSGRQYQSTVVGVDASTMTARALLERFVSTAGNNFINYSSETYDELFQQVLATSDDELQTDLYKHMEAELTANAANVYIQDMADLVAVRKGLEGLTFYPIYVLDVSTLYYTNETA